MNYIENTEKYFLDSFFTNLSLLINIQLFTYNLDHLVTKFLRVSYCQNLAFQILIFPRQHSILLSALLRVFFVVLFHINIIIIEKKKVFQKTFLLGPSFNFTFDLAFSHSPHPLNYFHRMVAARELVEIFMWFLLLYVYSMYSI